MTPGVKTRLAGQSGIAITEVMTAIVVLAIGILGATNVFAASKRTNLSSQRHEVAVQMAQRALEEVRDLEYDEIKLDSDPSPAGTYYCHPGGVPDTYKGCGRATNAFGGIFVVRSPALVVENIITTAASGPAGKVTPVSNFEVGTGAGVIRGKIYRYPTWRRELCQTGVCDGQGRDTKRVTVGVTLDSTNAGRRPFKPVWLSTVVSPPDSGVAPTLATGAAQGDRLKKSTPLYLSNLPCYASIVGSSDGIWSTANAAIPTRDNTATRNTAQQPQAGNGGSQDKWSHCYVTPGNTANVPDALLTSAPGGKERFHNTSFANDFSPTLNGQGHFPPLYTYSPEIDPASGSSRPWDCDPIAPARIKTIAASHCSSGRSYPGGLAMNKVSGCRNSYLSEPPGAAGSVAANKLTTHRWVTRALPLDLSGRATLSLHSTSVGGAAGRGTVCITLFKRTYPGTDPLSNTTPQDAPLSNAAGVTGTCVIDRPTWNPENQIVHFSAQFDFNLMDGGACRTGGSPTSVQFSTAREDELVLAISVLSSSDNNLAFLYDHPFYPSHLLVEKNCTPSPIQPAGPATCASQ